MWGRGGHSPISVRPLSIRDESCQELYLSFPFDSQLSLGANYSAVYRIIHRWSMGNSRFGHRMFSCIFATMLCRIGPYGPDIHVLSSNRLSSEISHAQTDLTRRSSVLVEYCASIPCKGRKSSPLCFGQTYYSAFPAWTFS